MYSGRTEPLPVKSLHADGIQQNNLTPAMTLTDFKTAFETIDRVKMMKILSAYGIPLRIVLAVNG